MKRSKLNNIDYHKLLEYGFKKIDSIYYYEKDILNNKFKIVIEISNDMLSKVIDNMTNDEYILVDVDGAYGNYVSKVKEVYHNVLTDIISKCINTDNQLNIILKYIKKEYKCIPEYLWDNDQDAAIRNKTNNKWFVVIMLINSNKLGLNYDKEVKIINLKYYKDKTNEIIDNKKIFPAWHMNKKSWISLLLDDNLDNEIIYSLIDNSYNLSLK